MDFDVLGFGLLSDEDVGKDDGDGKENNDYYQTLTQITYCLSHPFNTANFFFLGAANFAFRVMVMGHLYNGKWTMDNG